MRQRAWMFVAMAMFLSLFATSASGAGGTGGISFSAGLTPIGNGDAGSGSGAPTYNDAYDTGWTGRIEPYYDINPLVRGQVGVAYNQWGGKTFSSVQFEDLKVLTYYVGVKYRFRPNFNIRPYIVGDIGAAHIYGVRIFLPGVPGAQSQYWNNSTTVFFDLGGGVEFYIAPKVSCFLDIRAQWTGVPSSAHPPNSDSNGIDGFPITAGVNFTF